MCENKLARKQSAHLTLKAMEATKIQKLRSPHKYTAIELRFSENPQNRPLTGSPIVAISLLATENKTSLHGNCLHSLMSFEICVFLFCLEKVTSNYVYLN